MRARAEESADVLVIGAGASGSVAAKHLAEAGFSVVCLEQGDWVNASDYPGDKPEWELLAGKKWHPNPNVRQLPQDYPCETSDSDINPLMHNAVGGSTIHYGAQWMRLVPSDFRARSLDGVADDWPISYENLVPHYEQLDIEMGVSGIGGDPAYPPGAPPPLPALPIGKVGRKAAEGMNKLGWHWWPGIHSIPSQPYGRLAACTRRGTCMWGCAEGAKASMDLTHWPDALRFGARLVTRARVREITVNARGRATGAIYIDRDGVERFQGASVVIVAANGVGTPRLLLLSRSALFPDGLANSSGLVGKRLMVHPLVSVLGIYEEDLDSWLGPFGNAIYSFAFYETDESRGFPRGASWHAVPLQTPLGVLARSAGLPFEQRFGPGLHDRVRQVLGRAFDWAINADDLPLEENRVTLDPELKDPDGIPAPKVVYRTSATTRKLLDFHSERVTEAHLAAGAIETIPTEWLPDAGWHLLGTTRMGDDPATSVVNEWCQAHDVPNLYVIDGSVFVTAGGTNPTATICAIALRCAKHLIATAGNQPIPA